MARQGAAEIAATMRREIEGGAYRKHERLPASRTLADTYGVARNTLRDALAKLEAEGLLETRAGSGTYITYADQEKTPSAIEEASPLELIDARFALEPHVCRLCVLHGRREDFDALEDLCTRMENAANDPQVFAEADTQFHKTLVQSTRNSLLIWIIEQIYAVRTLDDWTRMRQLTLDPQIIKQYNKQHRQILNSIRAREPERAANFMKEHLETARLSLTRAADT